MHVYAALRAERGRIARASALQVRVAATQLSRRECSDTRGAVGESRAARAGRNDQ